MSERLDTRVRRLLQLREAHELASQQASKAEADFKQFQAELWSELEDEGLTTSTLDLGEPLGVVRIQRRDTKKARILNDQALIAAIQERGLEDELLKDVPRQKNLNAYVKTLMEHGEALPAGVEQTSTKYISITRKAR